jgi:FMN phosphatase YigB (HAD superfamily)
MIQAFLFDLDDTLLKNDIERFLPAYLKELSMALSDRFAPEKMVEALMAGTRAMLANQDPEITLEAAFDAVFYSMLSVEKAQLRPTLDRFYAERFPALRRLTEPMPGAREAVEAAFRRDARVAVATNPLFPKTAIRQRIEWAGLEPANFPFDLITSYEIMHFAKPRPEFFAEALAMLACSPENALLAGNDPAEDIAPARALGMTTFQAMPDSTAVDSSSGGSLSKLASNIEQNPDKSPSVDLKAAALPAILTGNLAALAGLLRNSGWRRPPAEEGWGGVEIACHLRDYECEILHPRLRQIVADENPFLSPVSSDTWPEERRYHQQDGETALRGFVAARRETISLIGSLGAEGWSRAARHAVFGPTTLAEQVRFVARHDLLHVEQLRASLAACQER